MQPLAQAQAAAVTVCVVVPHFKDEYWLSVGYGLTEEAQRRGARLLTYEAGGYLSLDRQIALMEGCVERRADAILLGAVSADDPRLLDQIAAIAPRTPVIALVNALDSPALAGAVGVDWHDMGLAIGAALARRHPAGSPPVRAALLSGPDSARWAHLVEVGLDAGLKDSSVAITALRRADTGLREQLREVDGILREDGELDYLIGPAPAIEAAMGLIARGTDPTPPRLIATYISHSVGRGLLSGQVEMVPYDDPVEQGRLGIGLALKAAAGGGPGRAGPAIRLIETGTPEVRSIRLSPAGFLPEIQ